MPDKTTSKIMVLRSIDQNGTAIKFETSRNGIQAWFVGPIVSLNGHGIASIEWESIEQAMADAIKNKYYTPKILKLEEQ